MYGNSDTPLSMQLVWALYDHIPETVQASAEPLYYWYQSKRADQRHVPPTRTARRREDAPDHVLTVVVDALRPDHVPSVGMPFDTAIAPSTWTFPSVTSMHTGVYPSEHGASAHTRPDAEEYAMPRQVDDRPTLPAEMEAAGYDTYGGFAFVVPFTALRGWYQTHRLYGNDLAENLFSDYVSWRGGRDRTFGYLHLGDLHQPIRIPDEYLEARDVDTRVFDEVEMCVEFDGCESCRRIQRERFAEYRAALDYVEDQLDRLLSVVGDDTLVVVVGDHGEGQGEHYERANRITDSRPNGGSGYRGNVGHGGTPFDVVARVPVGVSDPEDSNADTLLPEGGWPSLVDLAPTILEETVGDSRLTDEATGRPWQSEIPADRTAVCEAARFGVERKAAYRGDSKVIRSEADDVTYTARVEQSEPGEEFRTIPVREREELLASLPDNWEDFDVTRSVSPAVERRLEKLGYR
ncbi:sulfatase-like hydrolase/transferase (plasmid) [Halorussus limi]|uniref:Sulfatase-like hydrolase/transferase n=1 Tax=Halorussus limi TaxID=2938695 RepID=A0A8U0I061_9EURY|nr:sulfatase-like hydrolase/transferase [Halorussus limi]UPV76301.1 sulfatase-like hydrolase/transferase [Halorussus limi]